MQHGTDDAIVGSMSHDSRTVAMAIPGTRLDDWARANAPGQRARWGSMAADQLATFAQVGDAEVVSTHVSNRVRLPVVRCVFDVEPSDGEVCPGWCEGIPEQIVFGSSRSNPCEFTVLLTSIAAVAKARRIASAA